jgi:hypothetical protein
MTSLRLSPSERFAGALWGVLVAGAGAVCIAVYSGHKIDLELLGIGVLAAAGLWLMASALAGGMSRRRRKPASGTALADSARATAQAATQHGVNVTRTAPAAGENPPTEV